MKRNEKVWRGKKAVTASEKKQESMETELRTQDCTSTPGLRFEAVAYSYSLSLLIYMPVGYI